MAEPNCRWWYALGVFIALGNFSLAIVSLLNADFFLFLVGICVGTFVAVPLVQEYHDDHQQPLRQGSELNGKPLEVILGQLGSPASREDVGKLRCLIEDIRRDERAAVAAGEGDAIRSAAEAVGEYLQAPPSTWNTIERLITQRLAAASSPATAAPVRTKGEDSAL